MAEPTTINLTHQAGDTWRASLTFFEDDGVTPSNIAGYTSRMQLRRNVYDTTPIATAAVTVKPLTNEIEYVLDATQTALCSGKCVYNIELTDSIGDVSTPIAGDFVFRVDATR